MQRVLDGEVSPYLVEVATAGRPVRAARSGRRVLHLASPATPDPVLLVAGGSGIVPLMAMIRTRSAAAARVPFRLVYSVRDPPTAMYGDRAGRAGPRRPGTRREPGSTPRSTPDGWPRPPGRLDAGRSGGRRLAGRRCSRACYVCGPTGFVEAVADLLVEAGHDPGRVRTERFGPSG